MPLSLVTMCWSITVMEGFTLEVLGIYNFKLDPVSILIVSKPRRSVFGRWSESLFGRLFVLIFVVFSRWWIFFDFRVTKATIFSCTVWTETWNHSLDAPIMLNLRMAEFITSWQLTMFLSSKLSTLFLVHCTYISDCLTFAYKFKVSWMRSLSSRIRCCVVQITKSFINFVLIREISNMKLRGFSSYNTIEDLQRKLEGRYGCEVGDFF